MKLREPLKTKILASAGALAIILAYATPASAQVVACPAGYGYSPGYGCVPAGPGYAAVYGPPAPVYAAPPVYDPLTIAFGFGGGDGGHHYRGHDHHDDHHDDHGHH